jgi:hypothetical protein
MNRKRLIVAGATAVALLASGAVVASALTDVPQDAQPVPRTPTADLNRQPAPPAQPVPQEPAPEASPAPAAPIAITPPAPVIVVVPETTETEDTEETAEVKEAPAPVATETAPTPGRRTRRRVAIV